MLVTSIAAFRVAAEETGFNPTYMAGHSLGEYSALTAANSLELSKTARLVRERGIAMQEAVPPQEGTMAAIIGLDDDVVGKLCVKATANAHSSRLKTNHAFTVEPIVEPANYNAPGQTVVAGSADAVEEALKLIKTDNEFAKGKAIPLQVSAPFHCKLMSPAREKMADLFSRLADADKPKTPKVPYLPNRTARPTREATLVFNFLVEQIDHPVLWKQTMTAVMETGCTTFIEFGPGKVLAGLLKRIAQNSGKQCQAFSVSDPASLKNLQIFLKS